MDIKDFKIQIVPLQNKIFRFAKRLLLTQEEAEDVTQDVFLKLWTKRAELAKYKSVEALAMTMTKNKCLDKLKSFRAGNVELNQQNITTEHTPFKHTELDNSINLMNSIINGLPHQQKIIVQLREIEGYEFNEIAEVTGLKLNAVRVNLSRARQKIKEEMEKIFDYGIKTN